MAAVSLVIWASDSPPGPDRVKILGKTIKDRPESSCPKYTKNPNDIFIQNAHSLGQSYMNMCPRVTYPPLPNDSRVEQSSFVLRFPSAKQKFSFVFDDCVPLKEAEKKENAVPH